MNLAITGRVAALAMENVDTDQIVPVQFLVRTRADGYADTLFHNLRSDPNDLRLSPPLAAWGRARTILVSGANFGCGSSREQAAWALADAGFKCVVAPSFSGIFRNNALRNGLLAISPPTEFVAGLLDAVIAGGDVTITIDILNLTVDAGPLETAKFSLEPFWQDCFARGLTEQDVTNLFSDQLGRFEKERRATKPWLFAPAANLASISQETQHA